MKINFLSELCHTFPRLTVIVSEGLHRQEVLFYETMALFMCSRADRGQHGGGSRCGIDTEHCFNTVAAAVAGRYFRRLSFRGQRPIPHSSVCARAEKKSVQNFCRQLVRYCRFENRKNDRSRRIYHNRCAVRRQISADSL